MKRVNSRQVFGTRSRGLSNFRASPFARLVCTLVMTTFVCDTSGFVRPGRAPSLKQHSRSRPPESVLGATDVEKLELTEHSPSMQPSKTASKDNLLRVFSSRPAELSEILGGTGRSRALWENVKNGFYFTEENTLPYYQDKHHLRLSARSVSSLLELTGGNPLPPQRVVSETVAPCGTVKLLVEMEDGMQVETVLIPNAEREKEKGTTTLCVSSQVGCARGCIFCATGKMGLVRNLRADEILAQVFFAQRRIRESSKEATPLPPLMNCVFMGMGEPLNNPKEVLKAVEVLTDRLAFALGPRHVTVSTVGPSPASVRGLREFRCGLAWSLHSAVEETRRQLVPTSTHSAVELRDAFLEVIGDPERPQVLRSCLIEATLLEGLNDDDRHADAMLELLKPFPKEVKVNLLPYNDIGVEGLARSPPENVAAFARRLQEGGRLCFVRTPRGDDDSCACGQLATASSRKKREAEPAHAS